MPNSTVRTGRALGVVLATCLMTAGCATLQPVSQHASGDQPAGKDPLASYYSQKLDWRPCPAEEVSQQRAEPSDSTDKDAPPRFECATLTVPLDYENIDGDTITLALNRAPATDPSKRIGSLLTNPGGSGGPGLELVYNAEQFFTPALRARYDIIGMDPRGVGKSDPVRCQTPQEQAQTAQQYPDDMVAQIKAFVTACEANSGRLLPHVGTDNVAWDLDVVRAALGEDKLHYLGFSYGTAIGLFYAQQFPGQVGRMVLDSVVDPADWPADPSSEVVPFETTLEVFVATCTSEPDCPMGTDRAEVLGQIDELAEQVKTDPLPAGPELPPVDEGILLGVLSSSMYHEEIWPALAVALAAALEGDGEILAELAGPILGSAISNDADDGGGDGSFTAVACLHERPEDRTEAAATVGMEEALTVAPIFGPLYASTALSCAYWPAPSLPQAGHAVTDDDNIPPILLVNNLYDPATHVEWARDVHGQLPRSVLVTNTGGGHIFYGKGECTNNTVDGYLLTGKLPAKGTVCHDQEVGLDFTSQSE